MAVININVNGIQGDIQFKDEGVNQGAAGAATTVDFVGAGVTAVESAGTLTVTIPGGGEIFNLISEDATTVTIAGDLTIGGTGFPSATLIFGQDNASDGDNTAVFGRANTINGTGAATENSVLFGTGGTINNAIDAALFSLGGDNPVVTNSGSFNVHAEEIVLTSTTPDGIKMPSLTDGLVVATGGTGLLATAPIGTGVQTALGVNVGSAGAPVVNGGALGTPSSGTATNLTGTATGLSIGGNAATVTSNADLTGPVTSTGNATAIADGALSIAKTSGLQAAIDAKVADAIADGVTTIAPSQNAVFDALALKQPLDADLTTWAGIAPAANVGTFLATPSSANLAAALTDEAGTNKVAFGTSGVEVAYTGTITWTAGAAPSSTANLRQFYTQVGNQVTWQISLTYATAGTTITNVSLTFPTEFPTPAIPTGFTGASVWLWNCFSTKFISTPSGTLAAFGLFMIRRNAADTGFNIESGAAVTSGTYRTFIFGGTYFTA